ncbi:N-acetyltransferase [Jeotgalibacillus sp. R-1-5s-1]|uniref:GNAT family N-acetyltransferase n=1 Tax=Jeotgalibacillus sp. R-1-5s-1 TaxID=2555897 RepID=UPI001069BA40|nr:GNAT family N-acetyltransferase [Jeotgalibacillus sp. R-1-5s-1]TFD97107.1 GNAT family N-acetyltransferase [Jeotgalibacillus sp. R-1-5s-1]
MWRDSKEKAIHQAELHTFEDQLYFLNHILLQQFTVELAISGQQVAGMIAYNDKEISQLYIHKDFQGKGIGEMLLNRAKEQSSGELSLYTFEVNTQAQAFYAKHGFDVMARGSDNEENLPDLLLKWQSKTG